MLPLLGAAAAGLGGAAGIGGMFMQPDIPSTREQLAKVYGQYFSQNDIANFGYKNAKKMLKDKGIAWAQTKLQEMYSPLFEQQQLDSMNRTAPQVAEMQAKLQEQFGPRMALANQAGQMATDPQFFDLRQQMGSKLGGDLNGGLTDLQSQYYANQMRSAQAARGMADSPLGSQQEALHLTQLDAMQRQQNIANMQGFLNSYRTSPNQSIGIPSLAMNNMVSEGPGFNDVLSLQNNLSGLNYAQQSQNQQGMMGLAGSLMGMGGSMMGKSF